MSEKSVQSSILRYLNALPETWAVKIISSNRRGTPDILAVHRGRLVAIECKSDVGSLSDVQKIQLERVLDAGGISIVARSVGDVATALELANFCKPKDSSRASC